MTKHWTYDKESLQFLQFFFFSLNDIFLFRPRLSLGILVPSWVRAFHQGKYETIFHLHDEVYQNTWKLFRNSFYF